MDRNTFTMTQLCNTLTIEIQYFSISSLHVVHGRHTAFICEVILTVFGANLSYFSGCCAQKYSIYGDSVTESRNAVFLKHLYWMLCTEVQHLLCLSHSIHSIQKCSISALRISNTQMQHFFNIFNGCCAQKYLYCVQCIE